VDGACYPLSVLPGLSRLFLDAIAGGAAAFYPVSPAGDAWMTQQAGVAVANGPLADLLEAQNHACHGGPAAIANIALLRTGARAVVTGQQVGLFGGPLYTLHKAATAVRLASKATEATGMAHVPVFWLATEDHDFAEIDHAAFPGLGGALETVRVRHAAGGDVAGGSPVGGLRLGSAVQQALAEAKAMLGDGPEWELLRRCYRPEATFAGAFAQWLAATFREQGLIVFDAAGRAAHRMGAHVLERAITEAESLETLLLERDRALEAAGYHRQVLVKRGASLLFLLAGGAENEPHTRLPLKRVGNGRWIAGDGKAGHAQYSTEELLGILASEPERLSPNALLRPVFQDAILPTAAYVGGPAEIAYFAQNGVLHEALLGRVTPVLPRLSATLISGREAQTLEHDGLELPEILALPQEELMQRVGARGLPAEGKRRLQAAGSAMAGELDELTGWMRGLDPGLGRSADVAASKMRYQMNRLRRLAARFELEKDTSIRRRVAALYGAVYPGGHLQERRVAAAAALARFGPPLVPALVAAAGDACPGHKMLVL
jgi:bacillithiol biosynthesis cysteine-adding enzyme BshC